MTQIGSVRVTVTVDVDIETAFEVFTTETDQWYRRGASTLGVRHRSQGLRIEPRSGGRLIELDEQGEEGRERGRVTVWEPPSRLVFVDRHDTEVDVRFEDRGGRTRVVLEHRGLDQLPPDRAATATKYSWRLLVDWFALYLNEEPRWMLSR